MKACFLIAEAIATLAKFAIFFDNVNTLLVVKKVTLQKLITRYFFMMLAVYKNSC
jgi:hypothetical protein